MAGESKKGSMSSMSSWRVSEYLGSGVAVKTDGKIIRVSNPRQAIFLEISPDAWRRFCAAVKRGEFDAVPLPGGWGVLR